MSPAQTDRRVFRRPLSMPRETVAFLLLNLADVVLTHAVLVDPVIGGHESNPAAAAWIRMAGLPGMVGFKFILVAVILVICELIHKYRPAVARRLLTFMCLAVCAVICYSVALILKLHMKAILMNGPPAALGFGWS